MVISLVSNPHAMKSELRVKFDKLFLCQVGVIANKVKSGQKMGCLFHEFGHISLVSSSNATNQNKLFLMSSFSLVETVDKQGQMILFFLPE